MLDFRWIHVGEKLGTRAKTCGFALESAWYDPIMMTWNAEETPLYAAGNAPAAQRFAKRTAGMQDRVLHVAAAYGRGAAEALAETLWPTRCAVCDKPGEVLCDHCRLNLSYIDWWRACPRCGAPYGFTQCTECNAVMLSALGRTEPAHDGCVSAVAYDNDAARIVRTWKDAGERRLARTMSLIMARTVPPAWLAENPVVVGVPATSAARRRRGFDHGDDLARELAAQLSLSVAPALARPRSRDQRTLARRGRLENMDGRLRPLPGASIPTAALVVDDVCTTGATLFSAADAVREAGAPHVRCLTFARVW
ncbi:ComF family protein [Paraeggerthella hongkongensis]|uniref:ComF family protein n=1 Tax=Paraeggerthella hongkongensis TaxID=230658 RepID=UPI001FCE4D35|nr:double zinc ribbon domain-containing protein [Paraeggerthella hongkongensis]